MGIILSSQPITRQSKLTLLQTLLNSHLADGHHLAVWRMPGQQTIHVIAAADEPTPLQQLTLEELEAGFAFAPFLPEATKYFIKADCHYQISESDVLLNGQSWAPQAAMAEEKIKVSKLHTRTVEMTLDDKFLTLVAKGIEKISAGSFEKVVASRNRFVALSESFDTASFFLQLCEKYPHALVNLVSSSATGTWIGATPELLVSTDKNMMFKTVALAGTQRLLPGMNIKQVAWTQKDIEEQALVSRYIINCFKKIRLREYEEHGPQTVAAGNVLHLKTTYEVDMQATNFPQLGSTMLSLLHPTSAVCGMPLEPALSFLKQHEGYDREFYSGYLGPVNVMNESSLYVNLRCMQILAGTNALLYAGAGITRDSDPQKEWEETEMKMKTLLDAIPA